MKNTKVYSPKSQIIHTLMCSLGVDRNGADALMGNFPQIQELDPVEFDNLMLRLQFKYLLSREDAYKLLIYRIDLFQNPNKIIKKETLFKNLYNCSDVEFGKMLKCNFNILDVSDEDILTFINNVQTDCELSSEFTRRLFSCCNGLFSADISKDVATLKNKIALLRLYGITTNELETHPDICGNSLENINTKLKFAFLTKTNLRSYVAYNYYRHQKEKIYARFMGQMHRLYRVNIYELEPSFQRHSRYSTEQLVNKFQWDSNAENYIDSLFERYHTMLNEEVNGFMEKINQSSVNTQAEN